MKQNIINLLFELNQYETNGKICLNLDGRAAIHFINEAKESGCGLDFGSYYISPQSLKCEAERGDWGMGTILFDNPNQYSYQELLDGIVDEGCEERLEYAISEYEEFEKQLNCLQNFSYSIDEYGQECE